jgi:hypothetical protein
VAIDRLLSLREQIENHGIKAVGICREDNSSLLARGKGETVFILDLVTGKKVKTFPKPMQELDYFQLSPGRRLVALSLGPYSDQCIEIREIASWKLVQRITGIEHYDSMEFSPDGSRLAYIDGEQSLIVVEISTGKVVSRIKDAVLDEDSVPPVLVFSPDGRTVAVPPDNRRSSTNERRQVRFYALASGVETGRIQLAVSEVNFNSHYLRLSPDGRLAAGTIKGEIEVQVWETASSQLFHRFAGHRGQPTAVEFSRDGRTLASGGYDGVVLFWDLSSPLAALRTKTKPRDRDLAALWTDLAGSDVAKAWAAIADLAEEPESLKFLMEKLQPVRSVPAKEIVQRVERLSSDSFDEREQATRELAGFYEGARPELQNSQSRESPPETRRRVQALLDILNNPNLSGDRLRQWRAVAVLERIGTPEAVKLLEELAGGLPEARLTLAAKDARDRLREKASNNARNSRK